MCKIINFLLILTITITLVLRKSYGGCYSENEIRHNFLYSIK